MSFTLPGDGSDDDPTDHWQFGNWPERSDALLLAPLTFLVPPDDPNAASPELTFVTPSQVFDPNQDEQKLLPAPQDMAAWIKNHPEVEIEKTEPVTVGGVPGTRFDFSTLESDVPLFRTSGEKDLLLRKGHEVRLIVLEKVAGEAVVIVIQGTKAQLEIKKDNLGFLPKAQEVLDSVEWEGT